MHELQYWDKAVFATLTYAPEKLPEGSTLVKLDLQKFYKRLRRDTGKIKHYSCGEYGEKQGRPHYHAIIFGIGLEDQDVIEENWPFGFVKLGTVTYDSARYVSDYIQKKYNGEMARNVYGSRQPPFQLQSQGLGKRFALEHSDRLREELEVSLRGKKFGLPKYYQKVLEISTDEKAGKAGESNKELVELFEKRRISKIAGSYYFHTLEAKRQHEENLKSRDAIRSDKSKL